MSPPGTIRGPLLTAVAPLLLILHLDTRALLALLVKRYTISQLCTGLYDEQIPQPGLLCDDQPKELYPCGESQKPSVGLLIPVMCAWFGVLLPVLPCSFSESCFSLFFFFPYSVLLLEFCGREMIPPALKEYTNLLLLLLFCGFCAVMRWRRRGVGCRIWSWWRCTEFRGEAESGGLGKDGGGVRKEMGEGFMALGQEAATKRRCTSQHEGFLSLSSLRITSRLIGAFASQHAPSGIQLPPWQSREESHQIIKA